jgi:hypothetical protein
MSHPPVHGSLLQALQNGDDISVFCPNRHGRSIDIKAAIDRFGPDFRIVDERPRFLSAYRCSVCDEKASNIIYSPGGTPTIR